MAAIDSPYEHLGGRHLRRPARLRAGKACRPEFDHQGTAPRFSLAKPVAAEALVRTLERALPYGTLQRPLQALRQGVIENRVHATVLEARVKEFVQQVQEFRERIEGRETAQEEPPAP